MQTLVSIILPVYNGEKYLKESINSILSQTYNMFELIIVDDCSTDSTRSIVEHYMLLDKRIKYIKNENNYKLPRSLNIGFENAKGKYLTWTSDDNIYHENAIEVMVDYLENHNDIQMVYCDYNEIDETGEFIQQIQVGQPERLFWKNIVGACFLYKSSIAKKIGGYATDRFLVEDYDYWLRIYLNGQITPLHKCVYNYRVHKDSLTAEREEEIKVALKKLQVHYLSVYEKNKCPLGFLFDYLEMLLQNESEKRLRIMIRLLFVIRHPQYVKYLISRGR